MIEKNRPAASSRSDKTLTLFSYETQRQLPETRESVGTQELKLEWFPELVCPICDQVLKRTKVTPCLHRFCASCISGYRRCPKCNESIFKKSLIKNDTNTDSIIDKFLISPKHEPVRRSASDVNHLFFSNRRTARRWHSGIGNRPSTAAKDAPTTSSPPKRGRPPKRPLDQPDTNVDAQKLRAESSPLTNGSLVNNNNSTSNSDSGSSSLSTISELANCPEQAAVNGVSGTLVNGNVNEARAVTAAQNGVFSPMNNGPLPSGTILAPVLVQRTSLNIISADAARTISDGHGEGSTVVYIVDPTGQSQPHSTANLVTAVTGQINCNGVQISAGPSTINGTVVPGEGIPAQQPTQSEQESNSTPLVNGNAAAPNAVKREGGQGPSINLKDAACIEDLFFLHRQHLSPGCEAEVILSPHASVFNDKDIPTPARRPHFIFCELQAKVEHLCAFIIRRTGIHCQDKTLRKKVEICPIKMEMSARDVFIMNVTGEGRYSTVDLCTSPEAASTRMFSIDYPFKALDEERTVESLKEEYIGDKAKPLRLIYKFVDVLA